MMHNHFTMGLLCQAQSGGLPVDACWCLVWQHAGQDSLLIRGRVSVARAPEAACSAAQWAARMVAGPPYDDPGCEATHAHTAACALVASVLAFRRLSSFTSAVRVAGGDWLHWRRRRSAGRAAHGSHGPCSSALMRSTAAVCERS
jgi:hypothetical protein